MISSIAILTQAYPSYEKPYANGFVHTRSIHYRELGIIPTVYSFSAEQPYNIDGIEVFPASDFSKSDHLNIFCHAPNLRNCIKALLLVRRRNIVFFFHGHEVLHANRDYPPPYSWRQNKTNFPILRNAYEAIKLVALPTAIRLIRRRNKVKFVFVSRWMQDQFQKNCGNPQLQCDHLEIIPNCVSPVFQKNRYLGRSDAKRIITIRPLDESKYAIDLVMKAAKENPDYRFDIYGTGEFFDHNDKPDNVTHFAHFIKQSDIPDLLQNYEAALMPTRYDAQGVSVCEFATFGIPVISSNIPVIASMLDGFPNVALLENSSFCFNSGIIPSRLIGMPPNRFDGSLLAAKELSLAS